MNNKLINYNKQMLLYLLQKKEKENGIYSDPDPDPDLHQNEVDPKHYHQKINCILFIVKFFRKKKNINLFNALYEICGNCEHSVTIQ